MSYPTDKKGNTDTAGLRRSPYDAPDEAAPAPPDPRPMAGPGASRAADWLAAQAGAGEALAAAAAAFARLDERLRRAGDPALLVERLALAEAGDLLWSEGAVVRAELLALHLADRAAAGARADGADLARGAWAARRLGGAGPAPDTIAEARAFLGRREGGAGAAAATIARPTGDELDAGLTDWLAARRGLAAAHPFTRAAAACDHWRALGLSGPGETLEPAVAAARIAAAAGRGAAPFAPIAFGAPHALRGGRGGADGLAARLAALSEASERALIHLDRIEAWAARATARTAGFSGRTPPALIRLLTARLAVSAPLAAARLGGAAATARRNLAAFEALGLAREITGQGRFRFWTAAV